MVRLYVAILAMLSLAQSEPPRAYADPARRFRFSYPASFGEPSPGTNNGFGDRVAAIRFSVFSSGIGGEAALTRGFPVIDLQAAGGLYDAIVLEVFPEVIRRQILGALQPLSATNFCNQIAVEQHLDPQAAVFATLTAQQRIGDRLGGPDAQCEPACSPLCCGRDDGDLRQGGGVCARRAAPTRLRRGSLSRGPLLNVPDRSGRFGPRRVASQSDDDRRHVLGSVLRRTARRCHR